jgi:hypothetical protein
MLRRGLRRTWWPWRQHDGTELADTRRLPRCAREKEVRPGKRGAPGKKRRDGGSLAAASGKLYQGTAMEDLLRERREKCRRRRIDAAAES